MAPELQELITKHNDSVVAKWQKLGDETPREVRRFAIKHGIHSTFKISSTYKMCKFLTRENNLCEGCFPLKTAISNADYVNQSLRELLSAHKCLKLDLQCITVWYEDRWMLTTKGLIDNAKDVLYKFGIVHTETFSSEDMECISMLLYAATYFQTVFPVSEYLEENSTRENVLLLPQRLSSLLDDAHLNQYTTDESLMPDAGDDVVEQETKLMEDGGYELYQGYPLKHSSNFRPVKMYKSSSE